jgi:L-alanine-DL-glutamate epimerase-like enolase superfamily enzyme
LKLAAETWPIAGGFTISRGTKTHAETVLAAIESSGMTGRGECVPYARYGETVSGVLDQIEQLRGAIESGCTRQDLAGLLPAGAARNALDCALWDLEAKSSGRPVWQIAGLPQPSPVITAFTISLASPEHMARAAREARIYPLLKLKLGGGGQDRERIAAVRKAAPDARLIVDANEAWRHDELADLLGSCAEAGVEAVEQPLPAGNDGALADLPRPVPVCADESIHDRAGFGDLAGKYDMINIKLDKTGGLTEALACARAARAIGLSVMAGCMVATSLAMAPALSLARIADLADLDGPLLLARDRRPGLKINHGIIQPAPQALWG